MQRKLQMCITSIKCWQYCQ